MGVDSVIDFTDRRTTMDRSYGARLNYWLQQIPGLGQWLRLSQQVYQAEEILHDRRRYLKRTS